MPSDEPTPAPEPTAEELARVLSALDAADAAGRSILESMDRSHQLFQDCIAEIRSARAVLAASNAASGMATAPLKDSAAVKVGERS